MTVWYRFCKFVYVRMLDLIKVCKHKLSTFSTYDSVLRDVADRFAPQHAVQYCTGRLAPWFDADCRTARRNCRRLQRRYRRTLSTDDRRSSITAVRDPLRLYRVKKAAYRLHRLAQQGHSSPLMWQSLSSLLGCDRSVTGSLVTLLTVSRHFSPARSTTS